MSEVFIGKDIHNNRLIAAKKNNSPYRTDDIFCREARLWLGLDDHPNIVKAHTVISCKTRNDGYEKFLFLDFIGDESGNSRNLQQGYIEAKNKFDFIIKTAKNVLAALNHARSIYPDFVHRDLKPDNILVDNEQNILVTDFGLGHISPNIDLNKNNSSYPSGNNTTMEPSGFFAGTLGYAAPEQYIDSEYVTLSTDIYSLGIVLYELLVGDIPYSQQEIHQYGKIVLSKQKIMPSRLSNKEQTLWKIINKMIQYDPDKRYKKINDLLEDINKIGISFDYNIKKETKIINKNNNSLNTYNKILSYNELNKTSLAEEEFFKYKTNNPMSLKSNKISRLIFGNIEDKKTFIVKSLKLDLSKSPIIPFWFFILFLTYEIIKNENNNTTLSYHLIVISLIFILLIESYINNKTSISYDIITLGGLALGICLSFIFSSFNLQTISGSPTMSIVGSVLGLTIPLFTAFIYEKATGREGLGGGTIKLTAMIGCWTGLLVLPILFMVILITITQFFVLFLLTLLPGELKWDKDTLSPRLYHRLDAIPTSTILLLATWFMIVFHQQISLYYINSFQ